MPAIPDSPGNRRSIRQLVTNAHTLPAPRAAVPRLVCLARRTTSCSWADPSFTRVSHDRWLHRVPLFFFVPPAVSKVGAKPPSCLRTQPRTSATTSSSPPLPTVRSTIPTQVCFLGPHILESSSSSASCCWAALFLPDALPVAAHGFSQLARTCHCLASSRRQEPSRQSWLPLALTVAASRSRTPRSVWSWSACLLVARVL